MILVTGPTGNVGSELTRLLVTEGHKIRVLVRNPEKVEAFKKQGAEVVLGDFDRRETYREALAGVDRLFLLTTMSPKIAEHETAFINASRDAGVKHVVLMSTIGAGFQPGLKLGWLHRASELALEASGMSWTVLRAGSFITNFFANLASVKGQGTVYSCTGEIQYAPVDARDVAAVAAKALTTPGHSGKYYVLTGPELLDETAMTNKLGAAIGKSLNVVNVPVEAAKSAMVGMGFPEWLAGSLGEFCQPGVIEQLNKISDDVHKVLGRPATSFDAWAKEFGGAFK
jgi:uncharacterized protein YbjT (DUF2867 family)